MSPRKRANNVHYLSAREVGERYGVKENTVWVWVARGKFPPPAVKVGTRCTRWDSHTLDEFDRERKP